MPEISSRFIAFSILDRYKPQSTNLSELLSSALRKTSVNTDHGFIRELVWGVVRHLKTLDWMIGKCSDRKQIDVAVRNILRLGLYQLIYSKDVPEYAALSESVELSREIGKPAGAGFVNAVLRKAQQNRDVMALFDGCPDITEAIALKFSYPLWMVKRWFERYGARETVAFCEAGNLPPKLTIRANTSKISREALRAALEEEGERTEECAFSPDGIRFISRPRLEKLLSFKQGLFCVQDEASQLASYLLCPGKSDEILDLCSGAGIKSSHLAVLAGDKARITAVDSSARQIERAKDNLKRLGIKNIKLLKADATKLENIKARKVLVDAPCSGLGAIRHKPDIKWNRSQEDITSRYPALQKALLGAAAGYVKPGGTLVYCTCTTEPEENERVVDDFLSSNTGFCLAKPELPVRTEELAADGRFFRTFPHIHGTDAFFGARLTRIK